MKKYLLIINPNAGKTNNLEEDLISFFKNRNIKLTVKKTRKALDAKHFAKKAIGKYPVVICVGGDGTINETINGLAESKTKLGIIPAGTENALAQGMGIPFDPIKAAEIICKGRTKVFDLGLAKKRFFILTAGVGLDAKAVASIEPVLKKILRKNVYPLTVVKTALTYAPSKLEIWLDDQVLPRWGYFVIIGNVKYYGGNIQITSFAKSNDGYLDVCIFKSTDIFSMIKYFISVASKGTRPLTEVANMEYFKVKQLKIKSKKPALAHTDAELIGETPVNIQVVPKAISIIVNHAKEEIR